MVNEDASIPGTSKDIVGTSAGIAGHRGEMMARATAHHTIVNAAGKATEAATTLFSQVREDVLLGDEVKIGSQIMPGLDNPAILDEPPEHLAALGSSIAKRHHMTSHIKLWDQMSKLRQAAQDEYESATTDAAREVAEGKISKVKDLQQQVMNDKTKTPFGVGDEDQGSAKVGNYTNNIFENTR